MQNFTQFPVTTRHTYGGHETGHMDIIVLADWECIPAYLKEFRTCNPMYVYSEV